MKSDVRTAVWSSVVDSSARSSNRWVRSFPDLGTTKHGIDLAHREGIFEAPMLTVEDKSGDDGEERLQSLGLFYGVVVFMVWVDRPGGPHT